MSTFAGTWTYRSFVNNPTEVGNDAKAALDLIFGEGVMTIEATEMGDFKGTLSFGGTDVMDLKGWTSYGAPFTARFQGVGRQGSDVAGWVYDYLVYLVPNWPNGVDQTQAFVGSVVRTVPHGQSKAGYVASVAAVKHR